MVRLGILAIFGIVICHASASAQTVVFDFEEFADTGSSGHYTSLTMSRPGVQATVTRSSGVQFDTQDQRFPSWCNQNLCPPTSWGNISLSPFHDFITNDSFVVDFNVPVRSVSIETGDFSLGSSGDDSDSASMVAWSAVGGTGGNLGQDGPIVYGLSGFPTVASLSVSLTNPMIRSVVLVGGSSSFPDSMFWDNLTVTIPEPASAAFLGILLLRRRGRAVIR